MRLAAKLRTGACVEEPGSEAWLYFAEWSQRAINGYTDAIATLSAALMLTPDPQSRAAIVDAIDRLNAQVATWRTLNPLGHGRAVDFFAHLELICSAMRMSLLDHRNIALTLIGESAMLDASSSWRAGLIIYELILDCARHQLEEIGGTILVQITRSRRHIVCQVNDDSGAAADAGRWIVDDLADSMGAQLKRLYSPHGTTVRLTLIAR